MFQAAVLKALKNNLVVSVQADVGEPFYGQVPLQAMIKSVINGGAAGLRLASIEAMVWAKKNYPNVPIIGITKPEPLPENFREIVYITPTWSEMMRVADTGADIVAIDGTARPRPNGETLEALVQQFKTIYPNQLLMADIATVEEALACEELGFDLIATTLCGYTQDSLAEPDNFKLLQTLAPQLQVPVVMEGRLNTPEQVLQAFNFGAFSAVVGSAITRPHLITQRFVQACSNSGSN